MLRPLDLRILLALVCASTLPACKTDRDAEAGAPRSAAQDSNASAQRPEEPPAPASLPTVRLTKVADGLTAPTGLATAPDGTMVVLEQRGSLLRLDDGTLHPFGDLGERVIELNPRYDERGLLGMAFHPDYPSTRKVYLYYSAPLRPGAPDGYDHTNVLSEFAVGEDGRLDPESERELLSLAWPAPNHDGGKVAFGPDRMLYVSMGDGGSAADQGLGHPPTGNGQAWDTLMGSILRIDPTPRGDEPYTIPPDNPFVGEHEGADEIWAYGLRNPYSFSFDRKTGELYAGDVGQDLMEEVDLIERGKNYGWSIKEGTLCFSKESPRKPPERCPDEGAHGEPLVAPILTYTQPDTAVSHRSDVHGISVIGGHVYRGKAIPELEGAYVFGDWSQVMNAPKGVLMAARKGAEGWSLGLVPLAERNPKNLKLYLRALGEDRDGELYALTSEVQGVEGETGAVWRIEPAG